MPHFPKDGPGRLAPTSGPPPELRLAAGVVPPQADKPAVPVPVRADAARPRQPGLRRISVRNFSVDPDRVHAQLFGKEAR